MIWCVEDDASIRDIEVYALQSTGFEAKGFEDGQVFWDALQKEVPELVILDVMLPGLDGIELLRRMKSSSAFSAIPVVMATAKGAEYDKIQGLDLGADYYLVKPFGVMELISRVKALLRRAGGEEKLLSCGEVVMDETARRVTVGGEPCKLTYKEYELLKYMLANAGLVLRREAILERVWGTDYEGESRTLDMHIKTLRQKLGSAGTHIRTVRSVGYSFEKEQTP